MAKIIKSKVNLQTYLVDLTKDYHDLQEDEFPHSDFQEEAEKKGRKISLTRVKMILQTLEKEGAVVSRIVVHNKTRKRAYRFV